VNFVAKKVLIDSSNDSLYDQVSCEAENSSLNIRHLAKRGSISDVLLARQTGLPVVDAEFLHGPRRPSPPIRHLRFSANWLRSPVT